MEPGLGPGGGFVRHWRRAVRFVVVWMRFVSFRGGCWSRPGGGGGDGGDEWGGRGEMGNVIGIGKWADEGDWI